MVNVFAKYRDPYYSITKKLRFQPALELIGGEMQRGVFINKFLCAAFFYSTSDLWFFSLWFLFNEIKSWTQCVVMQRLLCISFTLFVRVWLNITNSAFTSFIFPAFCILLQMSPNPLVGNADYKGVNMWKERVSIERRCCTSGDCLFYFLRQTGNYGRGPHPHLPKVLWRMWF